MFCNRLAAAGLVPALMLALALPLRAEINTGDQPVIAFATIDNKRFTTRDLRGRIVVIDFWSATHKGWLLEVNHFVRLNERFGARGLQVVSISLDADKFRAKTFAEQNQMTWPIVCDGKGWESDYATAFGVRNIPRTYLLSPEGQVLWIGHPSGIDQWIEDAMDRFPPPLRKADPRDEALARITEASDAIAGDRDLGRALTILAKTDPKADRDPKVSEALKGLAQRMLDGLNRADLERVMREAEPAQLAALDRLKQFAPEGSVPTTDSPAAATADEPSAKADADAPASDPPSAASGEAAPPVDPKLAARRQAAAADRLARAKKWADDGRDIDAYDGFNRIKQLFGDTAAAAAAGDRLLAYQQDEAFMARYRQAQAEKDAKAALLMGDAYAKTEQKELAIASYQRVLELAPDSKLADEANSKLRKLR